MKQNNPSLFTYLPYVTIRQFWDETKAVALLWMIVSGIAIALGLLTQGVATATESIWSAIPNWGWGAIAVSAIAWMGRGEKYEIQIPKLTFGAWFALSAVGFLIAFLGSILPTWGAIPVWFAFVCLMVALEALAKVGKENYEKLHKAASSEA